MSREKKSKVDEVVKLRKILDNSSDPTIKALISTDEKALDSVRRRLAGSALKTQPYYDRSFRTLDSLEPRVTVHPKITVSPRLITPPPKFKLSTTLPEFKSISPSTLVGSIPSKELPFTAQELYEIEKVDVIMHEPAYDSNLPEWQPVEETQPTEPPTSQAKSAVDNIPEFERVDIPSTSEKTEKVADWEPIPPKKEPTETLVQFIPVESPEPQLQKLSKKQEREAKKIQKTKEKEAKRLKKLELKKLKRETREKEQEAKQIIPERQEIQPTPEKTEFIIIKQKRGAKKPKKLEDTAEWESYPVEKTIKNSSLKSVCTYKQYTLYKRETARHSGKKKTIHFFSKEKPGIGHPTQLPKGYQIAINNKTGIPYLKKKK